ncbi:hypothetical protein D3C75_957890 [compost metagenome]
MITTPCFFSSASALALFQEYSSSMTCTEPREASSTIALRSAGRLSQAFWLISSSMTACGSCQPGK